MMKRFILATSLILAACSSDPEASGLDVVRNFVTPEEYVPPPRFTALFNEPRPVLDVEFTDLGVTGKLILEQQDGPYARYISADLGGIVLQKGMLHSMYGFGEPLAGADLTEPLGLVIAGRAGQTDRLHTYLNGEDRTVSRTYRCEVSIIGQRSVDLPTGSVETTLMSENCHGITNSFENLYWVDRKRDEIIQSRQWAGENIGSLVTQVTFP